MNTQWRKLARRAATNPTPSIHTHRKNSCVACAEGQSKHKQLRGARRLRIPSAVPMQSAVAIQILRWGERLVIRALALERSFALRATTKPAASPGALRAAA